ncbi:hypothetical protein [Azohydromonas aeria]|uniref:hypothetical protein n=1 Tax=Azohydromonas aeria TaxID=2590212 RepID=UPI0012F78CAD|nr:hypothetical protein [Azohydromonas aeria]
MSRRTLAIIDALAWPAGIWATIAVQTDTLAGPALLLLGIWAVSKLDWALADGERPRSFKFSPIGFMLARDTQNGRYSFTTATVAIFGTLAALAVGAISLFGWIARAL